MVASTVDHWVAPKVGKRVECLAAKKAGWKAAWMAERMVDWTVEC